MAQIPEKFKDELGADSPLIRALGRNIAVETKVLLELANVVNQESEWFFTGDAFCVLIMIENASSGDWNGRIKIFGSLEPEEPADATTGLELSYPAATSRDIGFHVFDGGSNVPNWMNVSVANAPGANRGGKVLAKIWRLR